MSEIRVKSTGTIKLFESDNTSHVTIASPSSLSANRTITIPDADVNLTNVNSIPTLRPNVNPLIINGDMAVAQRGTSVTGSTAGGYLTCDRVNIQISSIGTYTVIQESLTSGNAFNDGFNNAWRIDCTTADASPSASEYLRLTYRMETQDLSCFKKGTSNAQPYTLGFWVKSNKTGTAQVNLYDVINNRLVGDTYTINTANTWEYKILNYPADTSGALGDTNAEGIRIEFALDAGSTYTGGTIPSAWETRANGDRSVSDLSLADNTANDWAITGLQLEVGEYTASTIPPFQHESFGDNLSRCQRYYYQVTGTGKGRFANGNFFTQAIGDVIVPFPCKMRAAYSLSTSATSDIMITSVTAEADCTAISLDTSLSLDAADVRFTVGSNIATVGHVSTMILKDSGSYLAFDAEL